MTFTIFGARGFVGRNVVRELRTRGIEPVMPARDEWNSVRGRPLGHVIYAAGVTSDFRWRPFDTVRSHVCRLADVLEEMDFESFLYLSSTRVYGGGTTDLYNLSKLTGESLCLSVPNARVRIVRLSNVYGSDWESKGFIQRLIRDAVDEGRATIQTASGSERDYVSIEDAVRVMLDIAARGRERAYDLASGFNVKNGEIAQLMREITSAEVTFAPGAPTVSYPPVDVGRLRQEFGFEARHVLEDIEAMVADYRSRKSR